MKKLKVSTKGYKKNSPDKGEDKLLIPSNHITMKGVPHPVMGVDDMGNEMMMLPGEDYVFPGNYVVETPLKKAQAGMQIDYGAQARGWLAGSGFNTLANNAEKTHGSNPYGELYLNTSPNLGFLNAGNFVMNSLSEHLGRKEEDEYNRQMILLQSQNSNIRRPEGWEKSGNPFVYQSGGIIPDDVSFMAQPLNTPVFEAAAPSSPNPLPTPSFNIELSEQMGQYAQKANSYLRAKAPHTDITGEMLAQGAQIAFEKYGKVVPIQLALAQLQLEGYLAKGNKNKPQRTRNPFNVGNTDSGAIITHSNVQEGINAYYELIARSYLRSKTPMDLLKKFTNSKEQRYATDPNYESKLQNIISQMPNMQQGGKLSPEEARKKIDAFVAAQKDPLMDKSQGDIQATYQNQLPEPDNKKAANLTIAAEKKAAVKKKLAKGILDDKELEKQASLPYSKMSKHARQTLDVVNATEQDVQMHPDFDPSLPVEQQYALAQDNSLRTRILRGRNKFMNEQTDFPALSMAGKIAAAQGSAAANLSMDGYNQYVRPGAVEGVTNFALDAMDIVAPEMLGKKPAFNIQRTSKSAYSPMMLNEGEEAAWQAWNTPEDASFKGINGPVYGWHPKHLKNYIEKGYKKIPKSELEGFVNNQLKGDMIDWMKRPEYKSFLSNMSQEEKQALLRIQQNQTADEQLAFMRDLKAKADKFPKRDANPNSILGHIQELWDERQIRSYMGLNEKTMDTKSPLVEFLLNSMGVSNMDPDEVAQILSTYKPNNPFTNWSGERIKKTMKAIGEELRAAQLLNSHTDPDLQNISAEVFNPQIRSQRSIASMAMNETNAGSQLVNNKSWQLTAPIQAWAQEMRGILHMAEIDPNDLNAVAAFRKQYVEDLTRSQINQYKGTPSSSMFHGISKNKKGGVVKMQQGGQKSPIYTNDPNDPRLRAYQDSLNLHNAGNKLRL